MLHTVTSLWGGSRKIATDEGKRMKKEYKKPKNKKKLEKRRG